MKPGYLLLEIKLGIKREHCPTFIRGNMSIEDKEVYINFLKEVYVQKMPGLDPKISMRLLSIRSDK